MERQTKRRIDKKVDTIVVHTESTQSRARYPREFPDPSRSCRLVPIACLTAYDTIYTHEEQDYSLLLEDQVHQATISSTRIANTVIETRLRFRLRHDVSTPRLAISSNE